MPSAAAAGRIGAREHVARIVDRNTQGLRRTGHAGQVIPGVDARRAPATSPRTRIGRYVACFIDGHAQRGTCARDSGQPALATDRGRWRPCGRARSAAHERVAAIVNRYAGATLNAGDRIQWLAFVFGDDAPRRMQGRRVGRAEDVALTVDGDALGFGRARDPTWSIARVEHSWCRPTKQGGSCG